MSRKSINDDDTTTPRNNKLKGEIFPISCKEKNSRKARNTTTITLIVGILSSPYKLAGSRGMTESLSKATGPS